MLQWDKEYKIKFCEWNLVSVLFRISVTESDIFKSVAADIPAQLTPKSYIMYYTTQYINSASKC